MEQAWLYANLSWITYTDPYCTCTSQCISFFLIPSPREFVFILTRKAEAAPEADASESTFSALEDQAALDTTETQKTQVASEVQEISAAGAVTAEAGAETPIPEAGSEQAAEAPAAEAVDVPQQQREETVVESSLADATTQEPTTHNALSVATDEIAQPKEQEGDVPATAVADASQARANPAVDLSGELYAKDPDVSVPASPTAPVEAPPQAAATEAPQKKKRGFRAAWGAIRELLK